MAKNEKFDNPMRGNFHSSTITNLIQRNFIKFIFVKGDAPRSAEISFISIPFFLFVPFSFFLQVRCSVYCFLNKHNFLF